MNSTESCLQMCKFDEQVNGPPYVPLLGEYTQHVGRINEGSIALSNYRIILQHREATFSIPLGVIESVECKEIIYLHFFCKDAKSYRCSFPDNEACLLWQRRICKSVSLPVSLERTFAFTFYQWNSERKSDLHSALTYDCDTLDELGTLPSNTLFENEIKRLGFDLGCVWRISKINEDYKLCSTYPRLLVVPSSISDNILESVARFRSSRRIPAIVWRHSNGAVLARCSQPEVGWLGWRSSEDEDLIKALAEACSFDSPLNSSNSSRKSGKFSLTTNGNVSDAEEDPKEDTIDGNKRNDSESSDIPSLCNLVEENEHSNIKKVLVMDARSYATAVANRARGGGCECPEYYPTCEIQFMNLPNIHTIRKSFFALRQLVAQPSDIPSWLSMLENTRWLSHISALLKSATTAIQAITVEERPVLVHCSDGWDRTPQIIALAQILMDPYYRTIKGFEVLVEREWLEFGHKFSDRCGQGLGSEDLNERCPVFLQWLDCVHQLISQFKTAFQFNEAYLIKLCQHVYSNLFGNFLTNSSKERHSASLLSKTYSAWSLFKLDSTMYTNYLYKHTSKVLWPSTHPKDIHLWTAVYFPQLEKGFHMQQTNGMLDETCESEKEECQNELCKTKSCDNIAALTQYPNSLLTRRLSDPSIRDSFTNMAMLQSALGSEGLDDPGILINTEKVENSNDSSGSASTSIKNCEETLDILTNGIKNLSHRLESEDFKKVSPSMLKDLAKRSIEGSTDTLVAELGVIQDNKEDLSCTNGSNVGAESGQMSYRKSSEHSKNGDEIESETSTRDAQEKSPSNSVLCSSCIQNKKIFDQTYRSSAFEGTCAHLGSKVQIGSTVSNGNGKVSHFTPAHSRTPSSGIPSTPSEERSSAGLPVTFTSIDGLTNNNDEVNRRLKQINRKHQHEMDSLKRELLATKNFYLKLLHTKHHHNQEHNTEDQVSLPESLTSESSLGHESELSDASWEAVDDASDKPTLWVPDHAVDSCQGCNSMFWMGRGRHHCRSCGQIFCSDCSEHSLPIPKENLYYPVRVCAQCFHSLLEMQNLNVG